MKKLALIALTLSAPLAGFAAIDLPVFALEADGLYLNPDLSPVDQTYTLDLGFLDMTLTEIQNMTQPERDAYLGDLNSHFTSFAQFNFLANGTMDGNGSTYNGSIPVGASAGDRIYTYVQNAAQDLQGLFTSVNGTVWTFPNDPGVSQIFLNAGTPTALIGSISGDNGVLEQVPEPSTYAFIAGVMTLGLVAYRRRRS